jgi:N6-L-threonylcarbamoyladenine synthase
MCNDGIPFPCVGLVVSGGHTQLYYCRDYLRREMMGGTQDDAAGEAYDKVAGILGLGWPGGRAIDEIARKGDRNAVRFRRTFLEKDSLDFSFSGIKTAVLYYVRGQDAGRCARIRRWDKRDVAKRAGVADIAAGFQEAVVEVLAAKTLQAAAAAGVEAVTVSGGVAANSRLREVMREECGGRGLAVFFPALELCTDNGAMVAGLGYHYARAGKFAPRGFAGVDAVARATPKIWKGAK